MQDNQSLFSLSFDSIAKSHLIDTARWARFIAISGMIIIGLFIIAAFVGIGFSNTTTTYSPPGTVDMSDEISGALRMGMIIVSIVMGIITFFPLLFLLRFSNHMKTAIHANDQEAMNEAFLNMKRYFRFLGILFILGLVFYVLMIVIQVFASAVN